MSIELFSGAFRQTAGLREMAFMTGTRAWKLTSAARDPGTVSETFIAIGCATAAYRGGEAHCGKHLKKAAKEKSV